MEGDKSCEIERSAAGVRKNGQVLAGAPVGLYTRAVVSIKGGYVE